MSSRVTNASTGPNLVTAFNSHATDIETLQASLLALTSQNYVPTVGVYTAPTTSTRFTYSARGTAWTTMTRINQVTSGTASTQTLVAAGKWGTNSFYSITNNGTNTEIRRWSITSGGTIALVSTVTLVAAVIGVTKLCVLPVSDTLLRVLYYNGTNTISAQVTFDGVSTMTVASAGSVAVNYTGFPQPKGWLVGSSSFGAPSQITTGQYGGLIADRANTINVSANDLGTRPLPGTFASEWLGGGYEIRAGTVNLPSDVNNRMMIELCLWSDIGVLHLSQIKVPGKIMGSNSGVVIEPLSNGLVALTSQDSSGAQFTVLCTINLTTGTLGYVNTYTAGNFATTMGWNISGISKQDMNFDALNIYSRKVVTTPTAQKLGKAVYNSGAAAGSEFTSAATDDITYSACAGIAGIASITDAFIWQQFADIAVTMETYTATSNGMAAESWTMT